MSFHPTQTGRAQARRLTKDEIDRRIEGVLSEVASLCDDKARVDGDLFRPRWISPREMVRRMRPFLALN